MSVVLVYDDRKQIPPELVSLVGPTRFGEIVFRQRKIADCVDDISRRSGLETVLKISEQYEEATVVSMIKELGCRRVIHLPSSLAPTYEEHAIDRLSRLSLINDFCCGTIQSEPLGLFAASANDYCNRIPQIFGATPSIISNLDYQIHYVPVDDAFVDLRNVISLVDFLSGSFSSRYFNQVEKLRELIVKRSTNIDKIKAEHDFYRLLPENMRPWFVMPFDLKVEGTVAQYSMERLLLLDMGQQWVNGAITLGDFSQFLENISRFLDGRRRRSCSRRAAEKHFDDLYINKIHARQMDLESTNLISYLDAMLRHGTGYASLKHLNEAYFDLIAPYRKNVLDFEVIGHGDLCFSNILYDKRIRLLKLIDPKGATAENDIFTDPYYDFAKLSHSVLGGYDFVVNGLYEIVVNHDVTLGLVTLKPQSTQFGAKFLDFIVASKFDTKRMRLHEASLFLSMLPLHKNNRRNVLAFALIAAHILDEVRAQ